MLDESRYDSVIWKIESISVFKLLSENRLYFNFLTGVVVSIILTVNGLVILLSKNILISWDVLHLVSIRCLLCPETS